MITMIILLIISVILNVLLVWYILKVLKKLLFISNNIADLLYAINGFSDRLKDVHEMEMFYGEPILQNLIKHSREVIDHIQNYSEIYELASEDIETEEEKEEEEEEEDIE